MYILSRSLRLALATPRSEAVRAIVQRKERRAEGSCEKGFRLSKQVVVVVELWGCGAVGGREVRELWWRVGEGEL